MLEQLLLQIAQYPQHVPAQPLEDNEAEWYTFTHHKRDGMFEFFHIGLELKLFWLNGEFNALHYSISYLWSLEEESVPDVQVGVDRQAVHEQAEEPVDREQGRVHAVVF